MESFGLSSVAMAHSSTPHRSQLWAVWQMGPGGEGRWCRSRAASFNCSLTRALAQAARLFTSSHWQGLSKAPASHTRLKEFLWCFCTVCSVNGEGCCYCVFCVFSVLLLLRFIPLLLPLLQESGSTSNIKSKIQNAEKCTCCHLTACIHSFTYHTGARFMFTVPAAQLISTPLPRSAMETTHRWPDAIWVVDHS